MTRLNNELALLHFEAGEKAAVMVQEFQIDEALNEPFEVTVYFLCSDAKLEFDSIIDGGAAFSLYSSFIGERVWSGVCTDFELLNSEEHADATYKGMSRYCMRIRPALWRLSLRRNSRIFQHESIRDIVKKVLGEYSIEVEDKCVDDYPKLEFKVQYEESDLSFVSRLLEHAGITYSYQPADKIPRSKTPGITLSKLVLEDKPFDKQPIYPGDNGPLAYLGDNPNPGEFDQVPQMWGLQYNQRPVPLTFTVRDRNFRGVMDDNPQGSDFTVTPPGEQLYEDYTYVHGIFWTDEGEGGDTPIADRDAPTRIDAKEQTGLPTRLRDASFQERSTIRFSANALDLDLGKIFQIGDDSPLAADHKHPHQALFGPTRKFMVVRRQTSGRGLSNTYRCDVEAVFAGPGGDSGGFWPRYRPRKVTPKPRIFGVQSAVVVGPPGQEVFTDEFGRVRVQLPWDREHDYDDKSSCWMRVSQGWSGGGFGFIAIPRVGHEVLVDFFEGDPDQPIIVGCVYNKRTQAPYFQVTKSDALGDNWTKTAIRTDTSEHGKGQAGYNELVFQDQVGKELIHIQAQKELSIITNVAERHSVGAKHTVLVGTGGENGDGPRTSFMMTPTAIELRAPGCSLVVGQSKEHGFGIHIEAEETVHFHAGKPKGGAAILIDSVQAIKIDTADAMDIDTKIKLDMNSGTAKAPTVSIKPAHPPSPGSKQDAPWLPNMKETKPTPPQGFTDSMVGQDTVEIGGEKGSEAPSTNDGPHAGAAKVAPLEGYVPGATTRSSETLAPADAATRVMDVYGKDMPPETKARLGKDVHIIDDQEKWKDAFVNALQNDGSKLTAAEIKEAREQAAYTYGFNTMGPGKRELYLNGLTADAHTSFHETLHHATAQKFNDSVSLSFSEATTEYFANKAGFSPTPERASGLPNAYTDGAAAVGDLVKKMGSDQPLRDAYFGGNMSSFQSSIEKGTGQSYVDVMTGFNKKFERGMTGGP